MAKEGNAYTREEFDADFKALCLIRCQPNLFLTKAQFEAVKKMLAEGRKK